MVRPLTGQVKRVPDCGDSGRPPSSRVNGPIVHGEAGVVATPLALRCSRGVAVPVNAGVAAHICSQRRREIEAMRRSYPQSACAGRRRTV